MTKLIFFDTETTGNETKDFLVQIAYKTNGSNFNGLYKPEIKIPPEASAVHHISNKMVADKETFQKSEDFKKIKELFEDNDSVVVAHNAPFDLMIIEKENIKPKKFICTLRVARHLDPEGKIERYNLQYLRYLLEIEIDAVAHDALGDVLVLEQLFERLKNKMIKDEGLNEIQTIEKMIEISSHPSLLRTFNFGKHTGKKIEDVLNTDRGYLEWLYAEKLKSEAPDEDWLYTLKHYLGK
jgi:exodeoxyribonuclease X